MESAARVPQSLIGATYARISTAQQKEGISLEQQDERMVAYAQQNHVSVPEAYRFKEQGSGYESERSDYNKIRELIRSRQINVLIVYGADRYTRDPIHGEIFRAELRRNRVALHIITEGGEVDIVTPTGQFIRRQMDNFNWYWGKMIQQTVQDKKHAYTEQGVPLLQGTPPFGYRRIGKRDKGQLEADEKEAVVVRRIFELFDQGTTPTEITSMLQGTPTPTDMRPHKRARKAGYGRWLVGCIYNILRCETYAGTYHAYKRRVIEDENGERRKVAQPRAEWHAIPVPPLVSRELWERAQQRLTEGQLKSKTGKLKYNYLLMRRVWCGVCGYKMSGSTVFHSRKDGSRYEKKYYRCNTWSKGIVAPRCRLPYIPVGAVDATVWNFVSSLLADPQALVASIREMRQSHLESNQSLSERIAAIDELIGERTRELEELALSYPSAHGMLRTVLQKQADQLEEVLRGLAVQREKLQGEFDEVVLPEEAIVALEVFAEQVKDSLGSADFDKRRAVIEQLNMLFEITQEGEDIVVFVKWLTEPFRLTVMQNSEPH
ncbi:MAG TPA: recombinase family protein [Roseiflexaceae bacterium]|nr:recombinase family protein [Roseiflexaceae bacterium]HMP41508.1 recombinase family protein [Roseiflexaceae bacterium]